MKIKLTVSYDGTNYYGWQSQKEYVSVQQTLVEAIFKVTGEKVKLTASGRTDAGVHAVGQVASFVTNSTVPPENFAKALNTALPNDVKVLKSQMVSDDFNARSSAKRKTYRYSVYLSNVIEPLKDRYKEMVYGKIDIEKMISASKHLIGTHDFKGFCATGSTDTTTVRTIYSLDIVKNGEDVDFYITGNGFLYNMVRIIVGTLIKIGRNKLSEQDLLTMLNTGDRSFGGETISAKGLCLMSVEY